MKLDHSPLQPCHEVSISIAKEKGEVGVGKERYVFDELGSTLRTDFIVVKLIMTSMTKL